MCMALEVYIYSNKTTQVMSKIIVCACLSIAQTIINQNNGWL